MIITLLRRLEECPYATTLPHELQERVLRLAQHGQRHYALNLVINHCREQRKDGQDCRDIPLVSDVRAKDAIFCCHCDSDNHK